MIIDYLHFMELTLNLLLMNYNLQFLESSCFANNIGNDRVQRTKKIITIAGWKLGLFCKNLIDLF